VLSVILADIIKLFLSCHMCMILDNRKIQILNIILEITFIGYSLFIIIEDVCKGLAYVYDSPRPLFKLANCFWCWWF